MFLPEESIPKDDAPDHDDSAQPEASAPPAPSAKKATAADKSAKSKRKPAPKRVPWAFRVLPTIVEDWDAYMATLPRHISQQDVMEFMLTDFLKRKPKLPDSLLNPPSR